MGFEYALVYVNSPRGPLTELITASRHIKYTIPPAILLTLLYRPLYTRLDAYKVFFLITVRQKIILLESILTVVDRCSLHHTMGLVPDSHPHMELSAPCYHWSEAVRYSP